MTRHQGGWAVAPVPAGEKGVDRVAAVWAGQVVRQVLERAVCARRLDGGVPHGRTSLLPIETALISWCDAGLMERITQPRRRYIAARDGCRGVAGELRYDAQDGDKTVDQCNQPPVQPGSGRAGRRGSGHRRQAQSTEATTNVVRQINEGRRRGGGSDTTWGEGVDINARPPITDIMSGLALLLALMTWDPSRKALAAAGVESDPMAGCRGSVLDQVIRSKVQVGPLAVASLPSQVISMASRRSAKAT